MESDTRKSLRYLLLNGASTSVADTMSAGTVLIALASMFGASNFYLGLIVSIPYFANFMNIFSSYFLEKGFSCKRLSIISSCLSRPMYLIIAILPFITNEQNFLTYLLLCIFLLYFLGNITSGAFSVWIKRIVPVQIIGKFFAKRYLYMMVSRLICYTSVYFLLRYFKQIREALQIYAYSGMFFVAFCLSVFTTATFFLMKDTKDYFSNENFFNKFKDGIKDKAFINLSWYVCLFSFLVYLFFPFVSVFMLKSLKYSADTVIFVTIIFQLAYIYSSKFWGAINDKKKMIVPIRLSFVLLIFCIFSLMFLSKYHSINPTALFAVVSILHIVLGFANASFQLSLNNIPIICIPDEKANIFIPLINAFKSLFGGLGSLSAGIIIGYCVLFENKLAFANQDGWFTFFLLSFILAVFLILNISKIQKCFK